VGLCSWWVLSAARRTSINLYNESFSLEIPSTILVDDYHYDRYDRYDRYRATRVHRCQGSADLRGWASLRVAELSSTDVTWWREGVVDVVDWYRWHGAPGSNLCTAGLEQTKGEERHGFCDAWIPIVPFSTHSWAVFSHSWRSVLAGVFSMWTGGAYTHAYT
jgi:hypothetical protein